MIGVSKRQPMKCAVCAYGEHVVVTFTSVFQDTRLQDRFFGFLRELGVSVETESNGVPDSRDDKAMYPRIQYDPKKWKEVVNSFTLFCSRWRPYWVSSITPRTQGPCGQ